MLLVFGTLSSRINGHLFALGTLASVCLLADTVQSSTRAVPRMAEMRKHTAPRNRPQSRAV